MRYKGYVVTYIGESKKVNNDNFFLNGICKESVDYPFVSEVNKEFTSRNLYALSSGAKSIAFGDELAYIAVDLLRNFHVADFDTINREYFHVANTAITSQVLEKNDEHYEVDMSILSIDRDVATVYNMGDIPVFYYDGNKLENLAGKAPEKVEMAKDYVDNTGELQTEVFTVQNVPYIGELSSDMEVVPYTSKKIRLRKKAYFVLCSKEVLDVLGQEVIETVLKDTSIKDKHKALAILDKAVKAESEGNYTVEVVIAGHGLAIAERELKSMGKWFVVALACITICINSDFIIGNISRFVDGCKSFVQKYFGEEEIDSVENYRRDWDKQNEKDESDNSENAVAEDGSETVDNSAEALPESTVSEPIVPQIETEETAQPEGAQPDAESTEQEAAESGESGVEYARPATARPAGGSGGTSRQTTSSGAQRQPAQRNESASGQKDKPEQAASNDNIKTEDTQQQSMPQNNATSEPIVSEEGGASDFETVQTSDQSSGDEPRQSENELPGDF